MNRLDVQNKKSIKVKIVRVAGGYTVEAVYVGHDDVGITVDRASYYIDKAWSSAATTRMFIPWTKVFDVTYDVADEEIF